MKNLKILALAVIVSMIGLGCSSNLDPSKTVDLGTKGKSTLTIEVIPSPAHSPDRVSVTNVSFPIVSAVISLTDPLNFTVSTNWTNGSPNIFVFTAGMTGI